MSNKKGGARPPLSTPSPTNKGVRVVSVCVSVCRCRRALIDWIEPPSPSVDLMAWILFNWLT